MASRFHWVANLLLATLLGTWCFGRVTTDCHGNPDTAITGYIQKARSAVPVWGTCFDPDTQRFYTCIIRYDYSLWTDLSFTPDSSEAEQCVLDALPAPCLDCVMLLEMVVIDIAGRRSDQACP